MTEQVKDVTVKKNAYERLDGCETLSEIKTGFFDDGEGYCDIYLVEREGNVLKTTSLMVSKTDSDAYTNVSEDFIDRITIVYKLNDALLEEINYYAEELDLEDEFETVEDIPLNVLHYFGIEYISQSNYSFAYIVE